MQQYALERHHPIQVWGIVNICQVLIAPNCTIFTLCQVVMSIKSIQNLISPLFFSVDQSPKGEVVVTCDQSMKYEAEALLSYFGIYLEMKFGLVVWNAFTDPYRTSMKEFQYYPL